MVSVEYIVDLLEIDEINELGPNLIQQVSKVSDEAN